MNNLRKALVTGLGTGYLPLAPGSWASAAVVAIYLAVAWASGGRDICVNGTLVLLALAAGVACVALGPFAEQHFGKKDPGRNTADEWSGQALALLLMPMDGNWNHRLMVAGVCFFLFRLFDSVKCFPIRRLEKLPLGWGVLLDDLAAALYANAASQLLLRLWLLRHC